MILKMKKMLKCKALMTSKKIFSQAQCNDDLGCREYNDNFVADEDQESVHNQDENPGSCTSNLSDTLPLGILESIQHIYKQLFSKEIPSDDDDIKSKLGELQSHIEI